MVLSAGPGDPWAVGDADLGPACAAAGAPLAAMGPGLQATCAYEAFWRAHVAAPLGIGDGGSTG